MIMPFFRWIHSKETENDIQSISSGIGLLLFLILLKIHLACWFIFMTNTRADIHAWQIPLFIGGDMVVATSAAVVYFLLARTGSLLPRAGEILVGKTAPFLFHSAIVVFSVVSWQISLIYATPLTVDLLRAADDLGSMRDSIAAYTGVVPITYLACGMLGFFLLRRPVFRLLRKSPGLWVRWKLWGGVLTSTAVVAFLWFNFCKGSFDYGLKRNAVIHFVQYYTPAPKPVDMKALFAELESTVSCQDKQIRKFASAVFPETGIDSELAFARAKASGMNVLFILIESLSSRYADRKTMPNLCRLADTGARFHHYYTTSTRTDEALYAILYSDYLPDLKQYPRHFYNKPLPQPSLAAVLKNAGYRTALFNSGDLRFTDMHYLVGDFEVKMGALEITDNQFSWSWGAYEEQTVAGVSKWINEHKQEKFLLFYSTIFPHHPYFSPDGTALFGTDTWENKYRNSLHYVDRNIGILLDCLKKAGLSDKTMVVAVGDHGESVTGGRYGHGISMTPNEIMVPCIFSNPVLFRDPLESDLPANHLDLAPTIMGMLGLSHPDYWIGRNFAEPEVFPRQFFVYLRQSSIVGVVDDPVVFSLDEKNGEKKLLELEGNGLKPFEGDPGLSDTFVNSIRQADRWQMWRHLSLALPRN